MSKLSDGQRAENLARDYLLKQGLVLVAERFYHRGGEIDLIMLHKKILVFIEVRYKKNEKYVSALDSINFTKQIKIKKTAEFFLLKHRKWQKYFCRFDVVVLSGDLQEPKLSWLTDAFD